MQFKMQQMIGLGILLIFLGFVVVFIGLLASSKEPSSKSKMAIGGFIGPIPFGFGNDKNLVWFIAILSLAVFVIWLLFSSRIIRLQ